MLGTVVDRMKTPEERNLVAEAVPPVVADLTGHERGQGTRPEGQRGGRRQETSGHDLVDCPRQETDRHAQEQGRQQAAQKIIAEIDGHPLAEEPVRVGREETLQGAKIMTRSASHRLNRMIAIRAPERPGPRSCNMMNLVLAWERE